MTAALIVLVALVWTGAGALASLQGARFLTAALAVPASERSASTIASVERGGRRPAQPASAAREGD